MKNMRNTDYKINRIVSAKRSLGAIRASWWLEVRSVICSGRWAVVSLLSLFLMIFYMKGMIEFADAYGEKISPVVLPFLFSDSSFGNLGLMVLVFLMSVFPFRDNLQRGIRMKAGNKCYGATQILTMITLALVWAAELQILSILVIGTRCLFGSWGKIWGTCAAGSRLASGYNISVEVDMNIILNYEPWNAMLVSVLFVVLISILFAEIIFFLDALTGYSIGEIILTVYCFGFFAVSSLQLTSLTEVIGKYNPSEWMNISGYMLHEGSMGKTLLRLGILLMVFAIVDYQVIKRKIIE